MPSGIEGLFFFKPRGERAFPLRGTVTPLHPKESA
jgi:hypothetical protein